MKRFVLLHHSAGPSLPGRRAALAAWIQRRTASVVDVGAEFGPGRLITNEQVFELSLSSNLASGYSIIEAPHLDAAEQLLEGCPIGDSISLYEARPIGDRPDHETPERQHP